MAYWSVAQIKTAEYRRVIWHVERQGFAVYLPMCRPSRRSLRTTPLFPGYLFIRIEGIWRCLLGTFGVIDLIRSGNMPATVRPWEIEQMRRQENRDGVIVLPLSRYQHGDRLRVTRGPLVDRIGTYAGLSARDRVRVLFSMFDREVPIELYERDLTPL